MNGTFKISIVEQGWIEEGSSANDLCSHGKISLKVGGVALANEDDWFGISESALAMLRTLESNHTSENPVADRMVFHGCGLILMMGCPIGIDWSVKHLNDELVGLSDFVYYPETNEELAVRYSDLKVELSLAEYREQVVGFARKAEDLFVGVEKLFDDDYEKHEYTSFWTEYRKLVREETS